VESFLQQNYDCILTYHIPSPSSNDDDDDERMHREKYKYKIEKLALPYMDKTASEQTTDTSSTVSSATVGTTTIASAQDDDNDTAPTSSPPRILACLPCCIETELPHLCQTLLPNVLLKHGRPAIDTVVHSIAYASEMDRPLVQVSREAYLQAQHISSYSLIELVRECIQNRLLSQPNASITTLSYLGAVRTVPNYGVMSPAKAALECIVRTLALEVGNAEAAAATKSSSSITNVSDGGESDGSSVNTQDPTCTPLTYTNIRVNAVSAGPLKTTSARGITNFSYMQQHVMDHAPLRRNVTIQEVADTITWLSIHGTGITGQTIYVDAGYNSVVPIGR
jgi:enoyl-[acyl-carrier protein] reductase I